MMLSGSKNRVDGVTFAVAVAALTLAGCSKKADESQSAAAPAVTAPTVNEAANTAAMAPAAPAAAAPAPDNTDTLSGVKYASYTGDAAAGKTVFITCQTCHSIDPGVNKIGPSLHGVVGRKAGTIADFKYSTANKDSGITWTEEKLFQYLEAPQRVVPGTKMTFGGFPEPQKRADVIAYLKANS